MKEPGIERAPIADLGQGLSKLRVLEPAALREMERSVARHGQLTPLLAFRSLEARLEIVDGFKRLRAAESLRLGEVTVRELGADAASAKATIYVIHQRQGLSELEESWLVRSLYRDDHLTQPAIGQLLQRHKSWVCRRLALAEGLHPDLEIDVRLGLVPVRSAIALARLPRGNQVAAAAAVAGLTSRQTELFVAALLEITEGPLRDKAIAEAKDGRPALSARAPVRAKTPAEWIISDVSQLTRVAAHLQARLLERPLAAHGETQAEELSRNLGEFRPVVAALLATVDRIIDEEPK